MLYCADYHTIQHMIIQNKTVLPQYYFSHGKRQGQSSKYKESHQDRCVERVEHYRNVARALYTTAGMNKAQACLNQSNKFTNVFVLMKLTYVAADWVCKSHYGAVDH